MSEHESPQEAPRGNDEGTGDLRQKLHWATGDRDAEAEALADRSPEEVTADDARTAVARAHGDLGVVEPATESDVATPEDAAAVHSEHRRAE